MWYIQRNCPVTRRLVVSTVGQIWEDERKKDPILHFILTVMIELFMGKTVNFQSHHRSFEMVKVETVMAFYNFFFFLIFGEKKNSCKSKISN